MKVWAGAALALIAWVSPAWAAEKDAAEAFAWLEKMAAATHKLNYSGTFIYQRDNRVETTRIVHMVDDTGEQAKLVTLEGTPREMYRINNDVLCFLPDKETAVVDKSRAKKLFPAILPEQISGLSASYSASLAGRGRVAGREAQIVILEPKDRFRYGHRFWADTKTGLLLRAGVWKDKHELVDRFSFSDVSIGGPIDRSEVKPRLSGRKLIQNEPGDARDSQIDPGWQINGLPSGFKQISAMKRRLPGGTTPVNHIVFSDGVAALSVFIEAGSEKAEPGPSQRGALNVYTRVMAGHTVRVLGEVPPVTVRQVADNISFSGG